MTRKNEPNKTRMKHDQHQETVKLKREECGAEAEVNSVAEGSDRVLCANFVQAPCLRTQYARVLRY
jgi:hypothetical protein